MSRRVVGTVYLSIVNAFIGPLDLGALVANGNDTNVFLQRMILYWFVVLCGNSAEN